MPGPSAPKPDRSRYGTDKSREPARRVDQSAFANPEFHPTIRYAYDNVFNAYSGLGNSPYTR